MNLYTNRDDSTLEEHKGGIQTALSTMSYLVKKQSIEGSDIPTFKASGTEIDDLLAALRGEMQNLSDSEQKELSVFIHDVVDSKNQLDSKFSAKSNQFRYMDLESGQNSSSLGPRADVDQRLHNNDLQRGINAQGMDVVDACDNNVDRLFRLEGSIKQNGNQMRRTINTLQGTNGRLQNQSSGLTDAEWFVRRRHYQGYAMIAVLIILIILVLINKFR